MSRHFLCHTNDIHELTTREFALPLEENGSPISVILVRYEDQLYCYKNHCPHLGVPLNWQPDDFLSIERTHIQCATHGALFNPSDGYCISGPCRDDHLIAYPIECDENDKIWVIMQ